MAIRVSNLKWVACVTAVLTLLALDALGETATPVAATSEEASAPGNGDDSVLGEIIVTARRKEENSQTVPVSVTVVSANTLAQQDIETTNDLQRLVPGTILNGAGSLSNSTYTIRGQGKSVAGPRLPSVIPY